MTGMKTVHTLSASLALAVVAAVMEAVLRWVCSVDNIQAGQLALAVFGNVAFLGLLAIAVASVGLGAGSLLEKAVPRLRPGIRDNLSFVILGIVVALMIFQTGGLGLDRKLPNEALVTMGALCVGAGTTAFGRRTRASKKRRLSNAARGGVVIVWLFCSAITAAALNKTSVHIEEWMQRSDPGMPITDVRAPNVVLVVLDTLRADRLGVYGFDKGDLTPNLDRLADSSIVYTNALSTAPWTLPAHASLFTGLYPDVHRVGWGHYKLDDSHPVLSELLRDRGYATFAISNNVLLNAEHGFSRGFDSFIDTAKDPYIRGWRLARQCGAIQAAAEWMGLSSDAARDAGSTLTNALLRERLLARGPIDRPFFAFINYYECHDPYYPPDRYTESHMTPQQREAYHKFRQGVTDLSVHACGGSDVYDNEQIALLESVYNAEVAYQDEVVGELLGILEEGGFLENSWLVITSDHGELFGEGGMVYHVASSHYKLLHVPLIVRPPGGVEGRRIDAPVQPVDVFVTLLEETGTKVPATVKRAHRLPLRADQQPERTLCVAQTFGAALGSMSLTQRMSPQADLTHWLTWIDSVYADGYLLEVSSRGHRALFKVSDDPAMEEDLVKVNTEVVRSLTNALEAWQTIEGL